MILEYDKDSIHSLFHLYFKAKREKLHENPKSVGFHVKTFQRLKFKMA